MIQKDSDFIASCLKDSKPNPKGFDTGKAFYHSLRQWKETIRLFSYALRAQNSRFNMDRFSEMCEKE